jgi:hypothetical protein
MNCSGLIAMPSQKGGFKLHHGKGSQRHLARVRNIPIAQPSPL